MGYAKISIDKAIEVQPALSVIDMTRLAVADHTQANGCAFEEDAATRAVDYLGLPHTGAAVELPEDMRIRLGHALEALEVTCEHRGTDQANLGESIESVLARCEPAPQEGV